jgi:hypothetical protein
MRFSIAATLAFSLIACASTQTASNRAVKPGPMLASNAGGPEAKGKYTCDYEAETGSHRRQKICRYVDSDTDTIHATQDGMREFQSHQNTDTLPTPNPGGHSPGAAATGGGR